MMTKAPRRPVVRYHGGKWVLAKRIIAHFPAHRVYTEVFGGGGSVLMRKPRSYAEVYNDLDGEIVNVFRVLRDPHAAAELTRQLRLTPFAREEFELSYLPSDDPIEQARRTVARSYMGFGSGGASGSKTGFRCSSTRSGTIPSHDWANYPECLAAFTDRLQGVVIENRPAADVLRQQDSREALHYVDPPYVFASREGGAQPDYRFEMTDDEHRLLAGTLRSLQGMVILSGYPSELYAELFPDWHCVAMDTHAASGADRVECLWFNPAATAASAPRLFDLPLEMVA
jgi:DNA adenine methylase